MLSKATLTNDTVWSALLEGVPEFKPVFADEVAFSGAIHSHSLFEELFLMLRSAHEEGNGDLVGRVIDFINAVALSDEEELIGPLQISFLVRVPEHSLEAVILPRLNPAARKVYDAIPR